MSASRFDRDGLKWVHIPGPGNAPEYPVDYALALLGAEPKIGAVDFLMRVPPGGHCTYHRHIGKTTTYVLEGEHHLYERDRQGVMQHERREIGVHALSPGGHSHIEGGGETGGLIFFSAQAVDGHLFDLLAPDGSVLQKVTLDDFLAALA